jgi:hypothetical protein
MCSILSDADMRDIRFDHCKDISGQSVSLNPLKSPGARGWATVA